jgi:uncharacterized protein (DUF58 family)
VLASPALAGLGVVTGYAELTVLAASAAALVASAFVSPRIRSTAVLERSVAHRLVPVGGRVRCRLRVRAGSAGAATRVIDAFDGAEVPVTVPPMASGGVARWRYELPANRRGVHRVGPLVIERADPLELLCRSIRNDDDDLVWVHPTLLDLGPVRAAGRGWHEQGGGRGDDPSAEFRSLRTYVPGDDTRLVHWPTSARIGRLVVREVAQRAGADRLVLLDTAAGVLSGPGFEVAVEIAASLAAQGIAGGLGVLWRTSDVRATGPTGPLAGRDELLRLAASVGRTAPAATLPVRAVVGPVAADETVLVTGAGRSPLLARLLADRRTRPGLVVVRVVDGPGTGVALPVRTVDVRSAREFARRWRTGR